MTNNNNELAFNSIELNPDEPKQLESILNGDAIEKKIVYKDIVLEILSILIHRDFSTEIHKNPYIASLLVRIFYGSNTMISEASHEIRILLHTLQNLSRLRYFDCDFVSYETALNLLIYLQLNS